MRKAGFVAQGIYLASFAVAAVWALIAWWIVDEAAMFSGPQGYYWTAALVAHGVFLAIALSNPTFLMSVFYPSTWKAHWEDLKFVAPILLAGIGAYFLFDGFRGWFDGIQATVTGNVPDWFILKTIALMTVPTLIAWLPSALFNSRDWVKEHTLFRRWFRHGRGGSARWAGVQAFDKLNFDSFIEGNRKRGRIGMEAAPIYLGRALFEDSHRIGFSQENIGLNSEAHMLVSGMTGSGKTRDFLGSLHMTWPGGALIFDPKKEHYQLTADRRAQFGPVYRLDPWLDREGSTHHWNPLDEIDINAESAPEDIMGITEACVIEESGEKNSSHFRETTEIFFSALVAHVKSMYPEGQQSLPTCYDLLITGDDGNANADPALFNRLIVDMEQNPVAGGIVQQGAALMNHAGELGERGAIITTLLRSIKWCSTPSLRKVMDRSDFTMRELKADNATVYLVVPFRNIYQHRRWLRLALNMGLIACQKVPRNWRTHRQSGKRYYYRTLFSLDEFGQIGTCKPVQRGLNTLRSNDIKAVMAVQNIGQLKDNYNNWHDFISATDKVFFGVNDHDTADTISSLLGKYIERLDEGKDEMEHERALLTPDEVQNFLDPGEPHMIVKPSGGLPLRLQKVPYWKLFAKSELGTVQEMPEHIEPEPAVSEAVALEVPVELPADVISLEEHRTPAPAPQDDTVKAQISDFLQAVVDQAGQNQAERLKSSIDEAKSKDIPRETAVFDEQNIAEMAMDEAEARRIFQYDLKQPIGKPELVSRYGPLRENSPEDFRPKVDEAFEVLMTVAA